MKAKTTVLTILFCLGILTAESPSSIQDGDELASRLLAGHIGASALSLAVVRGGKVAVTGTAGILGDGARGKVDGRTLFPACSLTKPVFTFLVLRLVEEGLLDLDQPLVKVLGKPIAESPDYRDVANDPRLGTLTARLVLTHRTGFPNWRRQRQDKKLAFEFNPGASFSYSGEGYLFLQRVIEQRTGRTLDQLCKQYVFEPLGMKASRLLLDDDSAKLLSFDLESIPPYFQEKMRKDPDAAGSLLSNAGDYARFLEAVIVGRGLGRSMAEAMRKPLVPMTSKALFGPEAHQQDGSHDASGLSWCLGWIYARGPLGEMYFHIGAEGWFENFALFFPQRQEGLVVFSSGENPAGLVREAVKLVFGDTGLPFDWMGY
jgi:CubicO group peptidase (beta-lactamase class C family)